MNKALDAYSPIMRLKNEEYTLTQEKCFRVWTCADYHWCLCHLSNVLIEVRDKKRGIKTFRLKIKAMVGK